MSPSEIAFLALGLVLGSAVGAAIAQSIARRPGPSREVRLTIAPNAIPTRRAYTLSVPSGIAFSGPLPGSPDARALTDGPETPSPAVAGRTSAGMAGGPGGPVPAPAPRTRVPSGPAGISATAIAVPVVTIAAASAAEAPGEALPGVRGEVREAQRPEAGVTAAVAAVAAAAASLAVGVLELPAGEPPAGVDRETTLLPPLAPHPVVPATRAIPPAPAATRAVHAAGPAAVPEFTTLVRPRPPVEPVRPVLAAGAMAVPMLRPVATGGAGARGDGGSNAGAGQAPGTTDACAPARRFVDERCALSEAARVQARSAVDALREAQRVYDVLRDRVDRAQATADPRQVAAAKERLHADFRQASDRAAGPDETEAAARAWLGHINELNAAVREAQRVLESGNAELRAQVPVLDRLAAEADAARIAGENAEAGCRDAREELAACEEAEATARAAVPPIPEEPDPFEGVWPDEQPGVPEREAPADLLAGLPLVVRILRGDREARQRLVAILAAGDADAERDWQIRIAKLVDAIVARAIEDGYLVVPDDDPFWRLFEPSEARDIVGALSALGYRYDGMGGFADGRVPAARDLGLAVGYAGLDRMRIRTWPREAEIAALYDRAVVSADEWLADQAGDLSLGRMVDALGNRAAELADVWNAWGRVRPTLLAG